MIQPSQPSQLQSFVAQILEESFKAIRLSELEKFGYQLSIRDIFEKNRETEAAYYELLDYFEAQKELRNLVPKVEMYYQHSLPNNQ